MSAAIKILVWDSPIDAARARRQLAVRHHVAAEPLCPRYGDIDKIVLQLPYGLWKCTDGRVVIFNRGYLPIWQRLPDGTIERADAGEWVPWVMEAWFDADKIRFERGTRDRLREILRRFFAGEDIARFATDDFRHREVPR